MVVYRFSEETPLPFFGSWECPKNFVNRQKWFSRFGFRGKKKIESSFVSFYVGFFSN